MNSGKVLIGLLMAAGLACGQEATSGRASERDKANTVLAGVLHTEQKASAMNQSVDDIYIAPVYGTLFFSGTFGELRNNHFHSGLDIRTAGVTGWPILAVADGQVVRIRVGPWGFGKAVYIAHNNGTTSVYGHLEAFNGAIESYALKEHNRLKSNEIEVYPPAGALEVKQGDTIAWSGNTGGSGGPHLHFELRNSRNEHTMDPRNFGFVYPDTIVPKLFKLVLYQLNNTAYRQSGRYPAYFFGKNVDQLKLPPGTYGLGYYGNDYCTDFANRLGINDAEIFLNDKSHFRIQLKEFSFDHTRYINNHFDYYTYKSTGIRYVKLFEEERNPLPFYKAVNGGKVVLKEGDSLRVRLVIKDLVGQENSTQIFIIGSSEQPFPASATKNFGKEVYTSYPNKTNYQVFDEFKWTIPKGVLYDTFDLAYRQISSNSGKYLSDIHQYHYDLVPMQTYSTISIKPKNIDELPKEKLCIVNLSAGGVYEGGSYSNGWVNTRTRSFGKYAVSIDTTAPKLVYLGINNEEIRMSVSDNLSGITKWDAWLDGEWFHLYYEPKNNQLKGQASKKRDGQKHSLRVVVKDDKFNKTELNKTIIY